MAESIALRIQRQDSPAEEPYWQNFRVARQPGMNVISCLQEIAANPVTADGQATCPVAWDANCLEEVCGACSIVINGRVRQACSALVDNLLKDLDVIELRPMGKFPTVRDLIVDRSRMFESLKKVRAWIPIDGLHDLGAGPKVPERQRADNYLLARCMTCGCCLEACPQYNDRSEFIGAAAISQAVLFNAHPTGKALAAERLEALMEPGGIGDCGNAQNCVEVCPKEIPLTESIAMAGRQTTIHGVKRWLGR
jgi:succinate dehydrogenase / fumarate reductase iron-sulfur subunit